MTQYLILDVATTDIKRVDRAATQPLQTHVCQSLTVTQVEIAQFTQPDKLRTQHEKKLLNRYVCLDVCVCVCEVLLSTFVQSS